jgi:DnaJ-like protein
MDPYRVLGLEPGATPADVKRAYRRLAKALHPDAAGERALPAFLELQDAYERLTGTKVRTVRPTAAPAGSAGTASQPFREPWRADPARARAAREQARTRRPWPGPDATGAPGPGPRPRTAGASGGGPGRAEQATGTGSTGAARDEPRARSRRASGDANPAGAARPDGARPRRKSSRKATMGSTSYDEARDPADPRWAGASWYGPTTGEYWIVNPREYADPRKHGPGYSSRGRANDPDAAPSEGEDLAPPDRPEGAARPDRSEEPVTTTASEPWARETDRPRRPPPLEPTAPPEAGIDASAPEPSTREQLDAAMRSFLRRDTSDPLRRLAFVLLAWPPLGFLAAWLIGSSTGCASYTAACDGTDPFLPWLAQGVILGTVLLAPALARILSAGTLTALGAVLPATAVVIVLGGARSAAARPLLGGIVAVAWTLGVVWGLRLWLLARRTSGRPEEVDRP